MNFKSIYLLTILFVLFSCKKDDQSRIVESAKDAQKKEVIFSNINKGWIFNAKPINSASQANTTTWSEWGQFLTELDQKPKKTIGAFQKKALELSKKVMALENNIPIDFNKPQIKSRINILITKVRMLDLFIHLDNIPDKDVLILVSEINTELINLQNQMDKIVQKNKIPLEEGESELLKMLDTARAIPNIPIDPNLPKIE
jgi:hypothetical protein